MSFGPLPFLFLSPSLSSCTLTSPTPAHPFETRKHNFYAMFGLLLRADQETTKRAIIFRPFCGCAQNERNRGGVVSPFHFEAFPTSTVSRVNYTLTLPPLLLPTLLYSYFFFLFLFIRYTYIYIHVEYRNLVKVRMLMTEQSKGANDCFSLFLSVKWTTFSR